jgi:hypothetical protein
VNSLLLALFGFIGGLIFGLLVAWGMVSLVVAMVGMIVMIAGVLLPTMFKSLFVTAILGFLISWIVSGGLSLL